MASAEVQQAAVMTPPRRSRLIPTSRCDNLSLNVAPITMPHPVQANSTANRAVLLWNVSMKVSGEPAIYANIQLNPNALRTIYAIAWRSPKTRRYARIITVRNGSCSEYWRGAVSCNEERMVNSGEHTRHVQFVFSARRLLHSQGDSVSWPPKSRGRSSDDAVSATAECDRRDFMGLVLAQIDRRRRIRLWQRHPDGSREWFSYEVSERSR
jgi:hypothetical protein